MSKKKARRKKRNPMPPALREYWAKKRAAKNRRKKRNSKRRTRKIQSHSKRTSVLSALRRAGYEIAPKSNPRRRRRNRKPKKQFRRISLPGTYAPKQIKAIKRLVARATGMRVVVK